jgi:5'-nucleotidase
MRRFHRIATAAAVIWLLTVAVAVAGGDYSLTILHTNDIHSHLAAFDDRDAFCDKETNAAGRCQGGAARLATAVARERARGGPTLLLDAGDQFQKSFFFMKYKDEALAFFMNRLGYDAMTVGNHEFDDGPATLARFIRSLTFPVIAANLDVSASPELRGLIAPYVVRELGGRTIGIIGATQPKAARISSPGPGIAFPPVVPSIEKAVTALRGQGVAIIIVLSHAGFEGDKKLAASVAGIDVIVGGHSHVLLGNGYSEAVGPCPLVVDAPDGGKTLVVTAGHYGRYLGVLHVAFDAAGRVARFDGNPVRLDAAVPEDPATLREVRRFAEPLEAFLATVVGRAESPVDAASCRKEECAAGDVLAEAMLEAGRRHGAVAALVNSGSVHGRLPAGPIRMREVYTAFPRPSALTVLTLSGADLAGALEHGLSALGAREGAGRFLQVAGLRFAYDGARPVGGRLGPVQVADASGRYRPLDPKADYRLAINDFLYRGGDAFTIFREKGRQVEAVGLPLDQLAARWLTAKSPVRAPLDGRIQAVGW